MNSIISHQLKQVGDFLRPLDYHGFKFHDSYRDHSSDSYIFTFVGDVSNKDTINKFFQLSIDHSTLINKTMHDVIEYIDGQVRNHPDLKKASHHQEFYKKFDELIK